MAGPTVWFADGAETNDFSRMRQTNGSPTVSTTQVKTGTYSYRLDNNQNFSLPVYTTTGLTAINFWWYVDDATVAAPGTELCEVFSVAAADTIWYVWVNENGELELYDANNTLIATSTLTLTAATWMHVCIIIENNVASSVYTVFVDGVEFLDGTGLDTLGATSGDVVLFSNLGDTGSFNYVDDIVCFENVTDKNDYFNSFYQTRVHRYRSTLNSATGDASWIDTTLDAGVWLDTQAVVPVDTGFASYNGGVSTGGVLLNDAGGSAGTGGPSTDTEVGDKIIGTWGNWRGTRGGGGGTAQWGMFSGSQGSSVTGGVSADSGKTLDVNTELNGIGCMKISASGEELYIADTAAGGTIYQYDMTTGFDLSTGSYASKTLDTSVETTGQIYFDISSDGKEVYVGDTGTDDMFQYTMSTAWDIGTATHTRTEPGTVINQLAISQDGTKMITKSNGSAATLEWTLSTAWDISTNSTVLGGNVDDANGTNFQFSDDGRFLLVDSGATIDVHLLRSAFQASTLVTQPMGVNAFDPFTDATTIGGVCWGDGGNRLFVVGSTAASSGNGLVKSYTLSDVYSAWNTDASFIATNMTVSTQWDWTTSVVDYEAWSDTVFPRKGEKQWVGFRKDGGGRDADLAHMMAHTISAMDAPVTSTPRTVTGTTAGINFDGTNHPATVETSTPREVTGTTEAINFDGTNNPATVTKNVKREPQGATVSKKQKKGLTWQDFQFDGFVDSGGHANVANMLDSSIGTSVGPGGVFTWGRGCSSIGGPLDNINAKPMRLEVRAYTGGDGDIDIWVGFDPNNLQLSTHNGCVQVADQVQSTGAWSSWFDAPIGNYNWDDPHNDDFEPFSYAELKNDLVVGVQYNGGASGGTVHAIEVRVWEGESVLTTGYFDGNISTTNVGGAWTGDANLSDGSTSTWGSHAAANTNGFGVRGNTITQGTADNEIFRVYVRARARFQFGGANDDISFDLHIGDPNATSPFVNNIDYTTPIFFDNIMSPLSAGSAEFEITSTNSAFWTPWIPLDFDSKPEYFNWADIANLHAGVRRQVAGDAGATLEVAKIEIAVVSAPPNDKRKGSKTKKNRGALGAPEVIDVVEPQATVTRPRVVTGLTEAINFDGTNFPATVSFATPRVVTGLTEAINFDGTNFPASLNITRGVSGLVESVLVTGTPSGVNARRVVGSSVGLTALVENAASVNRTRGASAAPEVVQLLSNIAVVNLPRDVTGITSIITATENASIVNRTRGASAAPEVVTLTENASAVTRNRVASALAEVVTLAENAAAINRSRLALSAPEVVTLGSSGGAVVFGRSISGVTESIALSTTPAVVNRARGSTSPTEVVQILENSAVVAANRGVISAVESLELTSNAANVRKSRGILGSSEVLILSENAATVDRGVAAPRNVTGITESIALSATPAGVNGRRIVGSSVEVTTVVENAASLNRTRGTAATSESVLLAQNAANVEANRGVIGSTEVLSLIENAATVEMSANRVVIGVTESIALAESAAGANMTRGVGSAVETLQLSSNPASIVKLRNVLSSSEEALLTSVAASIGRSRNVQGIVQNNTITAAAAGVFRGANLDVTGITAGLTLTEGAGTVVFGRSIVALTAASLFTSLTSPVNRSRQVGGGTELIEVTEGVAQVTKTRTGAQPGSLIWAHPDPEEFVLVDGRMIQL